MYKNCGGIGILLTQEGEVDGLGGREWCVLILKDDKGTTIAHQHPSIAWTSGSLMQALEKAAHYVTEHGVVTAHLCDAPLGSTEL